MCDNNVVFVLIFMSLLLTSDATAKCCNLYKGKWVHDTSYPLFNSLKCPSIQKEFDCLKYGRPDRDYLQYRWKPHGCDLPRFDGGDFLRMKGKHVMFVGDSMSENHWQSLVCLLHVADGGCNLTVSATDSNVTNTITFKKYGVFVSIFTTHYLVDIVTAREGRVLKLDSISDGDTWKKADVLIFNTWLWWYRRGLKQPWDIIEVDGKRVKDMDRMEAFRRGLITWSKWVNQNVNPSKTKVLFQGISPSHYNGSEFGSPGARNCSHEMKPLNGSTYPGGEPLSLKVLKQVLNSDGTKSVVRLLDITTLSQLRRDGHPSKYNGFRAMDCTHWCVAGVLETWNELLYYQLINA